jgi:hypothetical protein
MPTRRQISKLWTDLVRWLVLNVKSAPNPQGQTTLSSNPVNPGPESTGKRALASSQSPQANL